MSRRKVRVLTQSALDQASCDIEFPKRKIGARAKAHQVGIVGVRRKALVAGICACKRISASQVCLRRRKQLALLFKRGNGCTPADRSSDAKWAGISANVDCNSNPEYLRVSGHAPIFRKRMTTFKDAARSKDFVISAEVFLNPASGADTIALQTERLRPYVDGILLTDNQDGRLHLSPLAAASLVMANGGDPIVQLTCRNRNRIALLGELLGAAAMGVTSLVLIRGNRVPEGFNPRPKAVFDVDATELIAMASKIKADESLPALPDFYVGSIVTPHHPPAGWVPQKLTQKADAGAQFAQTHLCMDMDLLGDYMKQLVAAGIPRRLGIVAKIAVFSSAADARWLRDSLPNHQVPESLIRRLDQADDAEQEGVKICAEQLQQLKAMPGILGAHLVATRNLETIAAAVDAAAVRD